MIDLHTHSTASDGTFRPADLVREALRQGLTHLALTDHDGVGGLSEARHEAREKGLAFLGGLEISAEHRPGTMHILGYGFREDDAGLSRKLENLRQAREERNPKIVGRLRDLGMDISMEEVASEAGGKVVGRPHFAKVLLRKGFVASNQEAFDRFLAKGGPGYVDKVRLSPEESIRVIREAGGVAVLAHPRQVGARDDAELEGTLKRLAGMGLQGIECFYRDHDEGDETLFLSLAGKYGLVPTGGSDFHGSNRPDVRLGVGLGRMRVPAYCWEGLTALIPSQASESAL